MPMSVRSFEEMTSITDMKDGTYSVKMRPNCNVCAGHPNKTQNWQRSYFFLKSDDSAFKEPPREDYRVLWNRSCVGHPTSPVYPEDFLKSVRAVALLLIYRWSEITVERICELKDRIARREWRSDLPTVLPIRSKRLDIFPKDIQKQVSEAKRMGTLPDLSAILAAQLGLASGEGPSTAVPRAVEGSAEEASDVPPSGEPQKKKNKPVDEQSENPDEPTEIEEGDVQEEELQPEEEASEAEISGERNDAEEVGGGEESETPLNSARPDGFEEDSGKSPLLIRRHNDEVGDEARSPILASSREGTPVPIGEGAAQIGTSSRGSAILRRDRIARSEWRSDLPTVLPIRTKRLDIFPKDIQKQVSEAKRMGTLPDLSAMLAAQLGLASEEGPSTTVTRAGEVPPSGARNVGKGKKRKRGGSGVEGSAEEASDVPPSGEPQKKKRTKKPVDEQPENPEEPTEIEEGDVQEEELNPKRRLLRLKSRENGTMRQKLVKGRNLKLLLMPPVQTGTPVPIGEIGTSSRGSAILRRVPGVNFPDKDLIFGSEYEEAARAKLLIDMPMSVRSFEEMTSITDMKDGTYSVKMRPNCNVCAGHPNKTQNWQRSYFFLKSDDSAFEEPPREDYRVLSNRSCVGHPTSPVYPEDFLKSVRAVALLRIYRWSEIIVERICELKEWRSDLPTVLPIRTKRLDIFPKDIQKQVSEAKRMGTLPDLRVILATQLGLTSGEGPSTAVPRAGEVPPSGARNAGKGKKRKRGGSGVEGSAEEASDAPPSGEPQKKKKKKKRTKKSVDEQSENPEEPTEIEEGDVQEEELQPEEEAPEAEISGERNDAEEVGEEEEAETSLNAARTDGSEEDSGESPLLIRRHNDEDRIARREWRSDLPTVLPIRSKRLDIFPKDIQKQVSEAKRMGTFPDLSAILAAQLGLASGEGPSTAVPRAGEGSAEEASDVPPSGEPQKKKKKKKRTKKPVDEQSENPEEPSEIEEGDVQEEELQPEEEAYEAEISGERNNAEEVGGGEESETPLNAARPDGSEEDIGESPLLIRRHNDEVGDEVRSPILASSRERTQVSIGEGAAQIGTSSRGSAILRRVPEDNFPDKVSFHYEGPAPLVYVPEKCGEFLRQLRGRAKPLPAVKDLIFGSEYEEAARAKMLGDSATNVVIDNEEGPSTTVTRAGEVPPSDARNAGEGKKWKRGGSGVEGSAEEASDVPPSGEPQKKKKKKRTKKPVDEQSENPEEPTEIEEGDVQEEELQPEEEASEAEFSGERDDAAEVGEGEESKIPLNAARPDGSEEDSGELPLLIRRHNDEVGNEARSSILASSRKGTPVPIGKGVAQIGTSSRGSAILLRVPGVNFPDKVSFHYEGPAPLVYVPEKCGDFLRQLRGRAKHLPAVKDLIFGSKNEEAARAKLLTRQAFTPEQINGSCYVIILSNKVNTQEMVLMHPKAEVAKLEKIKEELENPNGLNLWKRVVIARGMNQGCVIKRFQ
ncbi:hypothetical protein F2Q69_00053144 [Brassica cretica]|uniref:Uncharacterized protein n=1 Tax=Brassica cretica TaxID=69181 RepID=A0A8S9N2W7_BRACR|nr:hypothetical protein F2Q69_00053144 [Brassica cretica]